MKYLAPDDANGTSAVDEVFPQNAEDILSMKTSISTSSAVKKRLALNIYNYCKYLKILSRNSKNSKNKSETLTCSTCV